jgi:hypothetical protein
MKRILAVALVLGASPVCAADAPAPGVPVGVGMVSGDQKAVFLPAKDGGIEAIDLAKGTVLWTNKDANKLAGASGKLVFAWVGEEKKANAFRIIAVDAESGKTVHKSDPIALPDWAVTGKTWGRTFRTAARGDAESVTVAWQAGAFYAGGAAPTPEIEAAARKNESGLVKVELKTGKVTPANGKPKDDDFKAGPAGVGTNKVGEYEFREVEHIPGFKPGMPVTKTTITLTVLKGDKEVWKRDLAGNPWSPPPP